MLKRFKAFLVKLFTDSEPPKRRSYTWVDPDTSMTVPEKDISHSDEVYNKIVNKQQISTSDLSVLMAERFDCIGPSQPYMRLRSSIIKDTLFTIKAVKILAAKNGDEKLSISLREDVFNLDLTIVVGSNDFNDIFESVDLSHLESKQS